LRKGSLPGHEGCGGATCQSCVGPAACVNPARHASGSEDSDKGRRIYLKAV